MIILIGGGGFVGSGFARYLASRDIPFVSVDRANYDACIGMECDVLINANGNSKKFLARDDPKSEFQASVASVRNSLADFKFRKYVFLSTSDVYPDCSDPTLTSEAQPLPVAGQSPYGFHKHLAELCVRHAAREWLIIRQGGFVGQGMKKNAIFDVLHGDRLWVHPDSRFQFIDTEDSARLIMGLVEGGITNEVFNLSGMGTIPVREIMRLAGRSVPVVPDAAVVHCEVMLERISRYCSIPGTVETVRAFLSVERDRVSAPPGSAALVKKQGGFDE
ncbi:MAG: NAD-dependent epimerase/dehydratase family protein [Proteobacteria bacterium]|nr:NAD-dependent epimerase/dehydratase family protein [Pseudomonadota bacterium]HQR04678.1 NAD-dependent epimerase/dehydratase family protein [Rhodocyclaceae bacterium]